MRKPVRRGKDRGVQPQVADTKQKAGSRNIQNVGLGTEISRLFRQIGLDADIPELRGGEITFVKCVGRQRR